MEHFRPQPSRRRPVSERVQRLVSYVWIIASLALPALGVVLVSSAGTQPNLTDTSHVVAAGETLTAIALRYSVSVSELVQANGLNNPNLIYVGQVLVIPRAAPSGSGTLYTIRAGDTLSAIARRYGVTVEEIVAANGLPDRNTIYVGRSLTIPVVTGVASSSEASANLLASAASYTLQRGDSLYRVSLIYGVTVDDLLAANDLSSPTAIYPGLQISVPASRSEVAEAPSAASPADVSGSQGGRTVVVQPGDTLSRIAVAYNVTVDGLAAANGLTRPDSIYAGQVLNVPEAGASARPYPAQTATAYTVQRGDTLSSVALRYGVTVQSLAIANGIQNVSYIAVGSVLSIPAATAGSSSVVYASVGSGLCVGVQPSRAGTGYFIRPVHGYVITQLFHPWHTGIDLAVPLGSTIYAADSGTVVFAGWNPVGYGNLVVLDHGNGWRTYYAHLSEVDVACGDWVPRGSIIAKSGSTGNSTGPHLHFELLRYGVAVNPSGYVRF